VPHTFGACLNTDVTWRAWNSVDGAARRSRATAWRTRRGGTLTWRHHDSLLWRHAASCAAASPCILFLPGGESHLVTLVWHCLPSPFSPLPAPPAATLRACLPPPASRAVSLSRCVWERQTFLLSHVPRTAHCLNSSAHPMVAMQLRRGGARGRLQCHHVPSGTREHGGGLLNSDGLWAVLRRRRRQHKSWHCLVGISWRLSRVTTVLLFHRTASVPRHTTSFPSWTTYIFQHCLVLAASSFNAWWAACAPRGALRCRALLETFCAITS